MKIFLIVFCILFLLIIFAFAYPSFQNTNRKNPGGVTGLDKLKNGVYNEVFNAKPEDVVIFPDFTLKFVEERKPTAEEEREYNAQYKGQDGFWLTNKYVFSVNVPGQVKHQNLEFDVTPFGWESFKVNNQEYTLAVVGDGFVMFKGNIDQQRAWEQRNQKP